MSWHMDFTSYGILIFALLSLLLSLTVILVANRRRELERRSRLMLEEISLRETELRYAGAVSAQSRRAAVELVWENLRSLDKLEIEHNLRDSPALWQGIMDLRAIQYELLDTLLNSDEDGQEHDLGRLRGLSRERRTELGALRGDSEAEQSS